jgi:hypothetical protein
MLVIPSNKLVSSNKVFLAGLSLVLLVPNAFAQATRTWVSGVGDDVNPCSRTAPCKTFAGAISKTAAGGEIDSLDPGGFGTVTITKSITIDGGAGQVGSILGSSTNGVNVVAGAADSVTLRNISINGGGTGITGISVQSAGTLHVENVPISGFATGINLAPTSNPLQVVLDHVSIRNNTTAGLSAAGVSSTATVKVLVRDSSFLATTGGPGLNAGGNSIITVRNSIASSNSGAGFAVVANSGTAQFTLLASTASSNGGPGLQVTGSSGTSAVVRVSGSSIFFNAGGVTIGTGGFVGTYGDNEITGSITGGTLTSLSKQ